MPTIFENTPAYTRSTAAATVYTIMPVIRLRCDACEASLRISQLTKPMPRMAVPVMRPTKSISVGACSIPSNTTRTMPGVRSNPIPTITSAIPVTSNNRLALARMSSPHGDQVSPFRPLLRQQPLGPDRVKARYSPLRAFMALRICRLTASRLKLAGACIGGNSTNVWPSFATTCWTKTKRQIS
jgi:hypothetical protein